MSSIIFPSYETPSKIIYMKAKKMGHLLLSMRTLTAFLFLSFFSPLKPQATMFSVTDYGAIGDGKHYDTNHIQAAIEACHAACGGHVRFPAGNYLTGTIYLRSEVILQIEENSTLLAGTNIGDYPTDSQRWYLVLGENVSNVGIMGGGFGGTIDGQGPKFVQKMDKRESLMVSWNTTGACSGLDCRPKLVGFFDSSNITLRDLDLREPSYWNLHIVRCDNTKLDSVAIEGDYEIQNHYGILIEDSNNTIISYGWVDNAGNAITLVTRTGPIYNVTVTQISLRSRSSAIKFGPASSFDFKHILFDNISIDDCHRGFSLDIRDQGSANDIIFSNIDINKQLFDDNNFLGWWGRFEPIHVITHPQGSNSKVGSVSNLQFINIDSYTEYGSVLSGSSEGILRNLKFINVNFTYTGFNRSEFDMTDHKPDSGKTKKSRNLVNNRAGIRMEYVDGLEIENMNMRWYQNGHLKEWRNALEFSPKNVNNISLLSFSSALITPQV